ncbi:uncharacterized protein FIESC28_04142 [Fusarium coffeatum]|uniref:Xylanolytic transcriptional activator regulatory domain-containing protein n=1 Tax=Fusarium coffeatum TaxID=231269 RepID=A0A366S1D3_9HYPO|nr:uncharacterized protein FIESC28_04142 [Fusarium coffeatum]RBR23147.1 hypothetical protein FIESC28_04142 [Fusarium coffeatum]
MASTKKLSASWSLVTSSKRLSRSSQAVSIVNQKAFIFGGELLPREPVDNRVDIVSLKSSEDIAQTLSTPSNAPTPRVGSPSTTIGSKLYLFSGRGGLEMKPIEESGSLWCYDTTTNTWDPITPTNPSASSPAGRSYHCITSDGVDKIYIHSGCPEQGRLSDLWAFDVEKKSWTELPSAPGPARGGASIAFLDGKIYRMNGFDGKTEQGGALDIFDINDCSWSTTTFKPDGKEGPESRSVSTLLPISLNNNSYLLTMFGERDPSSLGHAGAGKMLSDVWAFDLEEAIWQRVETGDGPAARGWFDADVTENEAVVHGGLGEDNERLGDVWVMKGTLITHVQALTRRVTELEKTVQQLRSSVEVSPAFNNQITPLSSATTETAQASSPSLTPQPYQSVRQVKNDLCFGQYWYFKGVPIFSEKGVDWMASKIGERPELNNFRLFGTQHSDHVSHPRLALPERQIVEELLSSFMYSEWSSIYPIIDPATIGETVESAYNPQTLHRHGTTETFVLAAVALCSKFQSTDENSFEGDTYANKAQSYLTQSSQEGTVENLQTALMLHIYRSLSGQWEDAAILHSIACRMIYDLKAHCFYHGPPSDQHRQKHMRNLFWLCYVLDKDISIRFGRPPLLTRDYCDLTLPQDSHAIYTPHPDPSMIQFPQDLQLNLLKENICLFLCSLASPNLQDGTILCHVRQLDLDLETWRQSIPLAFRPKLSPSPDKPQMTSLHKRRRIHFQLEYNYLTTIIHTAIRRCGAAYAADESLPDDLHSVYHSSSDLTLEASRTTLRMCKEENLLEQDVFGHLVYYIPLAALALFLNILIHPLDEVAQADLNILASSVTLFQHPQLTDFDLDSVQELSRFIAELVRLGNGAIGKTKRDSGAL